MITQFLIFMIKAYRYFISSFIAPSCRYTPTCSEFSIQALLRYGFFKGGWKSIKRVCRCHPWHQGGYDPLS